jgi:hypothetical protein
MATDNLDSIMIKKIETIAKLSMILNSSEKQTKCQVQIGATRMIFSIQEQWPSIESFPLHTYQATYNNVTHPDLEKMIEELNYYIKYGR